VKVCGCSCHLKGIGRCSSNCSCSCRCTGQRRRCQSDRDFAVLLQISTWQCLLHCTVQHCTVQHYTALHCTALYNTSRYSTSLYSTSLYNTSRYSTSLYSTSLYSTSLYSTSLHCTVQRCTALTNWVFYRHMMVTFTLIFCPLLLPSSPCSILHQPTTPSLSPSVSLLIPLPLIPAIYPRLTFPCATRLSRLFSTHFYPPLFSPLSSSPSPPLLLFLFSTLLPRFFLVFSFSFFILYITSQILFLFFYFLFFFFYFLLFSFILFYFILFYFILFYFILFYFILFLRK
jgi:hypothetical protein